MTAGPSAGGVSRPGRLLLVAAVGFGRRLFWFRWVAFVERAERSVIGLFASAAEVHDGGRAAAKPSATAADRNVAPKRAHCLSNCSNRARSRSARTAATRR
jgi:hypothetical protein